jgi:hypothetical protein
MPTYVIKDSDGNAVNRIIASRAFVEANFEHWEPETTPELTADEIAEEARSWRNVELQRTDSLMLLPDYPGKEALTTYRQALRDWPSTADFPDTKPVLGS